MDYRKFCKGLQLVSTVSFLFLPVVLGGCSVNPATGRNQFDGLMPEQNEASIGASQHAEILKQYGGLYKDQNLQNYVSGIGQKVARNTERPDVHYQFFLLDSPIVNAFALPGGYVYVTRGLLAVANDEAELAGVLGHEIGHVTARHQAARYSQSVLTSLGTSILGAAVGSSALSQALDVGSNLYISSYSREQESEADTLGIRYARRAGYDPLAVSDFLAAMDQYQKAQAGIDGEKGSQAADFFATHPQTGERVVAARAEAAKYETGGTRDPDDYLNAINNMTYGDSPDQGFVIGSTFYHPQMGFTFTVPHGYKIKNGVSQIIASGPDNALIAVDGSRPHTKDMAAYIISEWLENKKQVTPEHITINGHEAATVSLQGEVNSKPMELRLVAINWGGGQVFRLQFAIPAGLSAASVEDLKRTTYSFRDLSVSEIASLKPEHIIVITARAGDTPQTLASRMQVDENPTELFLALNNLKYAAAIVSGEKYKVISR